MSKLSSFIARAIKMLSAESDARLGDRTKYVGASDIAGCPRKAVLNKLIPVPKTAKEQLVLMRGHIAQLLYSNIFKAGGAKFEEELELIHPEAPFIKCHIDFTFIGKNRIKIVEKKSTDGIRDEPYGSWLEQLQVQMGLARLHFGKDVEIEGIVLVSDLNKGEYQEFGPFKPNVEVFNYLMNKAWLIHRAVAGEVEPKCEPGLLCGFCPYRTDCTSFIGRAELPEDVADVALELADLIKQKKVIDGQIESRKNHLLEYTGEKSFRGSTVEVVLASTYMPEGETVDIPKLKEDWPDAYEACKKKKRAYMKIEARRLPTPVAEEVKKAA